MKDEPNYMWEFLTHENNIYAGLGSIALATIISIPFGFGLGALPLIAFGAGELIASLYVPARIDFQEKVKLRIREENRTKARTRIFQEISSRSGGRPTPRLMNAWTRMEERVNALAKFAEESRSQMSRQDVERLHDANLDFLSLWLADLVIDDRSRSVDLFEIEERLARIEEELAAPQIKTDQRNLQLARNEYVSLITRQKRMQSRKVAIEAAMLSMPDQIEEIYQMIVASPYSSSMGSKLEESLAKLRLEEDLEAELSADLGEAIPEMTVRVPHPQIGTTQAGTAQSQATQNPRQIAAAKSQSIGGKR